MRSLSRHVSGLVSDLTAEYGAIDLVGRRIECEPRARDAVVEAYEQFGVVGGAGIRLRDSDDRVLLVQYDGIDGWVDPGTGRRPGESYEECACRVLGGVTGLDASVEGIRQIHVLYYDDWTERAPAPSPYVCFTLDSPVSETSISLDGHADDSIERLAWHEETPVELAYPELAERSGEK
ncbi:MAG: NUDIX domain-containing protein [Natronomonas sp.]